MRSMELKNGKINIYDPQIDKSYEWGTGNDLEGIDCPSIAYYRVDNLAFNPEYINKTVEPVEYL